jgi:hypothetical protein
MAMWPLAIGFEEKRRSGQEGEHIVCLTHDSALQWKGLGGVRAKTKLSRSKFLTQLDKTSDMNMCSDEETAAPRHRLEGAA